MASWQYGQVVNATGVHKEFGQRRVFAQVVTQTRAAGQAQVFVVRVAGGQPRQLHVERSLAVTDWDAPRGERFVASCRPAVRTIEQGVDEGASIDASSTASASFQSSELTRKPVSVVSMVLLSSSMGIDFSINNQCSGRIMIES